jgi:hypothetical protein
LTIEPNIDQSPRQFRQDIAMTLFEHGVAAIVPVETDVDPQITNAFVIKSMRVGRVVGWFPRHIRVSLYDDRTGEQKEVTVPKSMAAIIENPLYAVMNEPNCRVPASLT